MLRYWGLRLQFSSVRSLSHVWLFATPWTAAHQVSLSITSSHLLKLMSIESDFNVSILGVTVKPRKLLFMSQYSSGPLPWPKHPTGHWKHQTHSICALQGLGVTYRKLFCFLTFVSCWSYCGAFEHRGETCTFLTLERCHHGLSWPQVMVPTVQCDLCDSLSSHILDVVCINNFKMPHFRNITHL